MEFQELLCCAKRGESKAVGEMLAMYRPLLLKAAIVNGVLEEDLFQELCIVLWRCINNFQI